MFTMKILGLMWFCVFVAVSAAEASCDSSNESENNCGDVQDDVATSYIGSWTSAKGSEMVIQQQDPTSGLLQGIYFNRDTDYPDCFNTAYPLTGFAYGPQITFDVIWLSSTAQSCNSTTSWAGNFDVSTGQLTTNWVLARLGPNILGVDSFTKNSVTPLEYNLYSAASSESTINSNANVVGVWQSSYGSLFVVQSQSDNGLLGGYYVNNHPNYTSCQKSPYVFTGWVLGNTIGFTVKWNNEVENCGSTTAWAGYVQGQRIATQWTMGVGGSQPSISSGSDSFFKPTSLFAGSQIDQSLSNSMWKNDMGSVMYLTNIQSGIISGVYINRAAGYECQNYPYTLTGWYYPLTPYVGVISFSVAWQGRGNPSCNSVTGWAGQLDAGLSPRQISTNWNLASKSGIMNGENTFKQVLHTE